MLFYLTVEVGGKRLLHATGHNAERIRRYFMTAVKISLDLTHARALRCDNVACSRSRGLSRVYSARIDVLDVWFARCTFPIYHRDESAGVFYYFPVSIRSTG